MKTLDCHNDHWPLRFRSSECCHSFARTSQKTPFKLPDHPLKWLAKRVPSSRPSFHQTRNLESEAAKTDQSP